MQITGPIRRTTAAGLLAPLGAVVFTGTWAVLGELSDGYRMWDITVDGYSPVAQPISGLGLGATAPLMNAAFVGCGAAVVVGTWAALRTWQVPGSRALTWARRLLPLTGVGMAVCGVFDLESIVLHSAGFVLAVAGGGIGAACAARALGRGRRGPLVRWLQLAGPASLLGLVGFLAVFDPEGAGSNTGQAGLVQRLLVTVLMVTVSAVGVSALRPPAAVEIWVRPGSPAPTPSGTPG